MMRRTLALLLLLAACRAESDGTTTVLIVRHAEKLSAGTDPDLSPPGVARANALADVLRDAHASAAYVTQYKRTKETAAPSNLRQELVPVNLANPGDYPRRLRHAILTKHAGQTVLVVTHSNTIPAVVQELAGSGVPPLRDADYDRLYIIVLRPGAPASVLVARYGA